MANVLGNLIISLTAQTDAFARGMSDAKRISLTTSGEIVESLKKVGDQLDKLKFGNTAQWEKSGAIIGGVIAGIGVAAVTSSVIVAKEVAEQAKQMGKLSQSYGLPIEQISQLRVASKLTGVDMDTLAMGFGRLALASAKAAEGGKVQQAAFGALGISATDSTGKLRPMQQLLPDIAQKFSQMENGTGKTALAMQLFGRSGAQLIPFLNSGSDGIRQMLDLSNQLGLTWSTQDAEAAELFQQRLELIDLKGTALKENFVKGLLPALDALSSAFIRTDASGSNMARDFGSGLGTIAVWTAEQFDNLTTVVAKLGLVFEYGPWNKGFWNDQKSFIAEYAAALKIVDDQHEAFVKGLTTPAPLIKLGEAGKIGAPILPNLSGPANPDAGLEGLLNQARQTYNKSEGDSLATQVSNIEHLKIQLQQFAALHPDQIFLDINAAVEKLNIAEGELIAKYQGALQAEISKGLGSQIGGILRAPSSVPSASGEVQAQSELIELTKNLNDQNRVRLQLYEQSLSPLERYYEELQRLNIAYQDHSSDEYMRSLQQLNNSLLGIYDPGVRVQQEIANLNQLMLAGVPGVDKLTHQLKQLQLQLQAINNPVYANMVHGISSTFTNDLAKMATAQESLAQGWIHIWDKMVQTFAERMIDIGIQWLAASLAHKQFVASQQFDDARLAASNTFAAVSQIPIVGPVLAVPAAAAAFAAVMAFDQGGVMPYTGMAKMEKGEWAVPPPLTPGLAKMIDTFNASSAGSGHRSAASGGSSYSSSFSGGPMTIHVNGAKDAMLTAAKVGSVVRAEAKRQARRFGVS